MDALLQDSDKIPFAQIPYTCVGVAFSGGSSAKRYNSTFWFADTSSLLLKQHINLYLSSTIKSESNQSTCFISLDSVSDNASTNNECPPVKYKSSIKSGFDFCVYVYI